MKMSDDGSVNFSFKPKRIGQFKTPLTPKVKLENDNKVHYVKRFTFRIIVLTFCFLFFLKNRHMAYRKCRRVTLNLLIPKMHLQQKTLISVWHYQKSARYLFPLLNQEIIRTIQRVI